MGIWHKKFARHRVVWGLEGGQTGQSVIFWWENGQKRVFWIYGKLLMSNTLVRLGGIIVMGNWNKLSVSQPWDFGPDRCQKGLGVEFFCHFSGQKFTLCPISCLPEGPMCRLIALNESLDHV